MEADDNVKPSGFRPFFWGHIDNGEEMNWHEDWGMKIFPQFANFELVMDHIIWKARPPTRIRSVLQSWRAIKGGGGDWKKKKLWKWTCQLSSLTLYFDLVHFAKTLEWSEELEHCIAYVNSGTIKKISNCTPVWLLHHCSGIISKSKVTLKIRLEEIGKL